MDKKKIIIISLAVLVVALATGLALIWNNLKESEKQHEEIQELIALEQEEMLNDLQAAQMEYDELKKKILSNDSLLVKLEQEQLRTQQLYEELQSTKATNAAEIKRLKKELKTLRGVLENYMVQIDSLFRENTELKNENSKLIAGKKKVEKPLFKVPVSVPVGEENPELFEELRILRKRLADQQAIPAYIVLSDKTLHLLASQCPRTIEEFGMVSGIGDYKKEKYGKDFVETINTFLK